MSHLDDRGLVLAFEDLSLAASEFSHREHLRVAFLMLRGADFGEAALRFRRALARFATNAGVPGKVHETLTWAYLALVAERIDDDLQETSSDFLARNPDLLDHRNGALARLYDVDAITASPVARARFVLPRAR